jgi:hypothetical protein
MPKRAGNAKVTIQGIPWVYRKIVMNDDTLSTRGMTAAWVPRHNVSESLDNTHFRRLLR